MCIFLEGKAEAYRVWLAMLQHWQTLLKQREPPGDGGTRGGIPLVRLSVRGGAAGLATVRLSVSPSADAEAPATASALGPSADDLLSASAGGDASFSSASPPRDAALREAVMKAVSEPMAAADAGGDHEGGPRGATGAAGGGVSESEIEVSQSQPSQKTWRADLALATDLAS